MPTESPAAIIAPHPPLTDYYATEPERQRFVQSIFDAGAADYDRVERLLSLGMGRKYRREALLRAGLSHGMSVLDVATGTGLVAREEIALAGAGKVIGLDPSRSMLQRAVAALGIAGVMGFAEQLPLADAQFDFLSLGYALRHLSDLRRGFSEFHRVLRPGGRLCILEITVPENPFWRALLRGYLRGLGPLLCRLAGQHRRSPILWKYYWDTIETCVAPQAVLAALDEAGFKDVKRGVAQGIFSEYTGRK